MATLKQKEKKKKQRERDAHAKVLKRRAALRQKTKREREAARLERRTRHREMPYVDPEKKDAKIKAQLEHNLKVLKVIEEQQNKLAEAKDKLNRELEEEGHVSLKEKMDALEQQKNKELKIDKDYEYQDLKLRHQVEQLINGKEKS